MTIKGTIPQFLPMYIADPPMTERSSVADSYPISPMSQNDIDYSALRIRYELDGPPREVQPCRIEIGHLEININPKINPELLSQAMDVINQRVSAYFNTRTRDLLVDATDSQNPRNKCQDCVWFHKATNFCAVAPSNLTSLECGDRQVPEPPENLDYLEARSPERIALIQNLAQKLDIEPEMLEQKLFQGWLKNRELFDSTAKSELFKTQTMEIKTLGAYSIAQMELIRDATGLNTNSVPLFHTYLIVNRIKGKILAGCDFDDIMRSLLLVDRLEHFCCT